MQQTRPPKAAQPEGPTEGSTFGGGQSPLSAQSAHALIRATFDVEGQRTQELAGRVVDTTLEIGQHTIRLHANPDGSGFLLHLLDGQQRGMVTWEALTQHPARS